MTRTVEIEVEDLCYEVTIDHYQLGHPSTWDSPGEGGELHLNDRVYILLNGGLKAQTDLQHLVDHLVRWNSSTVKQAEDDLEEYVYQEVAQQLADEELDARESSYERNHDL